MGQITRQFEVAENEARFARNDVHHEALSDFKKMHSQRYGVRRGPRNLNEADPAFRDPGHCSSMRWWTWKQLTLLERGN